MSLSRRVPRTGSLSILLCTVLLSAAAQGAAKGHPASARKAVQAAATIEADFAALASQKPWACRAQSKPPAMPAGWTAEADRCAWQERLRMRRWSGPGDVADNACLSRQAHWWAWARANAVSAPGPSAWRSEWQAHSLDDSAAVEKRIMILQRAQDGRWNVTEWRWDPSPRPDTRRWQEGRWALLVARAAALRQPVQRETQTVAAILDANIGARAGETTQQRWQWEAGGMCLRSDLATLGPQQLQLPYSVDDSRLEQRSAMQLQLARRYPKANWLTPFRLVPGKRRAGGGARFYAIWVDAKVLKGQLWIPVKGDAPMVRVRIDAPVAPGTTPETLARMGSVLELELAALAGQWSRFDE